MYSKTKTVYYCEFCKKHTLTKHSIQLHELHCTLNPDRICRWQYPENVRYETHQIDLKSLATEFSQLGELDDKDVDRLRELTKGCPACMLSVVRLTNTDNYKFNLFNFHDEVERFNEESHQEAQLREYAEIEASWL